MGDLRSNHPELFEPEEKHCPICGSTEYKMERCIDGYTTCLKCGRHEKHGDFYTVKKDTGILYEDNYGKAITEYKDYIEANGGDGTLLKAIQKFKHLNKPFFGTASGTVNFLMNPEKNISEKAKYKTFNLIKVKVTYENPEYPVADTTEEFQAFNDIMIGGDMNSWIDFNVHDKDKIIGHFKGGGVIISTAQGSTGINRNNGGAILPLSSDQWYITGDKTNRHISVPIEPKRTSITAKSRSSVKVWIDGANHVIYGVSKIEISKGDEVQVIFNDYNEFKRKRRV